MDLTRIHPSKPVRSLVITLAILVAILAIFGFGMVAGYEKARFSGRFGDQYQRMFVDGRGKFSVSSRGPGMMAMPEVESLPGGHGAVGEIVNVSLPQIVVAGPDNLERIALIGDDTLIRRFRESASVSDLQAGETVVILGSPDGDGRIQAKLVRILPHSAAWQR